MTRLQFTKMEGTGNDFVVVNATQRKFALDPAQIRSMADRHTGIGFDQLLVIEPPRTAGTDFYYRIFNGDGNEVGQCGNGARCFVRYVRDKALSNKQTIRVETVAGIIEPRLEADGSVTVDMGSPRFDPADIPMHGERRARSYLDSNCSHCHQPDAVRTQWDGRLSSPPMAQYSLPSPLGVTTAKNVAAIVEPIQRYNGSGSIAPVCWGRQPHPELGVNRKWR